MVPLRGHFFPCFLWHCFGFHRIENTGCFNEKELFLHLQKSLLKCEILWGFFFSRYLSLTSGVRWNKHTVSGITRLREPARETQPLLELASVTRVKNKRKTALREGTFWFEVRIKPKYRNRTGIMQQLNWKRLQKLCADVCGGYVLVQTGSGNPWQVQKPTRQEFLEGISTTGLVNYDPQAKFSLLLIFVPLAS